jgi:hypothetical protein
LKALPYPTNPIPRACRTCDSLAGLYCKSHECAVSDVKQTFQDGFCYARKIDGMLAPTDNKYGRMAPTA